MTILCYPNFTCHCNYNARPKGFAVERQKSFSYKDPLFAGLFLPHALRLCTHSYSWIGVVFFKHAAVLSSAAGAGGFALRLSKLARNASRSRSALIRSLSSASFANALLLCARRRCAARCQMASCDASRLTLSPSLRIGPHLRYCCCSSVVERVIGNDEVGSSILPSSTRYFSFKYHTLNSAQRCQVCRANSAIYP